MKKYQCKNCQTTMKIPAEELKALKEEGINITSFDCPVCGDVLTRK